MSELMGLITGTYEAKVCKCVKVFYAEMFRHSALLYFFYQQPALSQSITSLLFLVY